MSVAEPLSGTDEAMAKITKVEESPPVPLVKEVKYSMLASAPPMEPPPLYFSPIPLPLGGEQLKETIASLVEYFLSRNYLEGDPYMVSQMNADRFLPVNLIVEKIASIVLAPVETEDVVNVISSSKEMSLDESKTMVCPNIKLVRNTVILRELPGIKEAEIIEMFAAEEALGKPTEITKEVSDCWFVSFETESMAIDALAFIRKQTYNGAPIRARLKQESLLRSSYAIDPVNMPYFNPSQGDSTEQAGQSGANPWDSNSDRGHDSKDHRRNQRFDRRGRPQRKGRDFNSGGNSNVSGESSQGRHGYGGHGGRNRRQHTGGNGRKRVNSGKRGAPTPINLGLTHFPPLLNAQEKSGNASGANMKKWTKSDLVAVIKALGENPARPGELPADCVAVLSSPNASLEVSKPMPRVETVDLPAKSKHGAPDYKAVVSAKPTPGKAAPKSSEKKANPRGGASPAGKGAAAKGAKHSGKEEDEEGKKGKKDEKKEDFQGKNKQKKRGGQGKGGESKGKGGAQAAPAAGSGKEAVVEGNGNGAAVQPEAKAAKEPVASPQEPAAAAAVVQAEASPEGSSPAAAGASPPAGSPRGGGQMSWANRVAKPHSPSPSNSSSGAAGGEGAGAAVPLSSSQ